MKLPYISRPANADTERNEFQRVAPVRRRRPRRTAELKKYLNFVFEHGPRLFQVTSNMYLTPRLAHMRCGVCIRLKAVYFYRAMVGRLCGFLDGSKLYVEQFPNT